ncbi:MAG: biotin transporter BioY [Epsilonproteobacteria bacterium]|nr:biotin transporter BioY [Campylobacterota bacterium]
MLTKQKTFHATVTHSFILKLTVCFALSWFYAVCSQIMMPLPFNAVPISIQPLPLLLCAWLFGSNALSAYVLYLVQGAVGAPFFAHGNFGIAHLFGPTGGYLFGFGIAMFFLHIMRKTLVHGNIISHLSILLASAVIYFSCGLIYLAWFVPHSALLNTGLYPFLLGDGLKLLTMLFVINCKRYVKG